jgi:hypothetical protein
VRVETITGPAYWASALVNGDWSGLNETERDQLRDWLAREGLDRIDRAQVVDVVRDDSGEAQEPRFTWAFDLYAPECIGARGGDVLDYVVHRA